MKEKILIWLAFLLATSCETRLSCDGLDHESVCVIIQNKSGMRARSVQFSYDKEKLDIGPLEPGEETSIVYESPGENECTLTILFDNGDSLSQEHGIYTEGGYRIIEMIMKDEIKVNHHLSY